MTGTLLFVYGSLRRGGWNERFLAEQEYLGEARTEDRCSLYICSQSGLPYLTLDPYCKVAGELYRVDGAVLVDIDDLEGSPESYTRLPLRIEMPGGEVVEAQAYVWLHFISDLELVVGGDWFDTLETSDDAA